MPSEVQHGVQHKVQILTSQISVWNLPQTVDKIRELAEGGGKHYICVSNVHTVVMGVQDPSYAKVTNEATLATADGVPLIWASRLVGGPSIYGRASGPDILLEILRKPSCAHLRHYFYGSTEPVLSLLRNQLGLLAPAAKISGFFSPPIRSQKSPSDPLTSEELEECQKINEASAEVIWVGLGAPKQEVWMHRARPYLRAPVLIGVGAAFDFLAGTKVRAPVWMQKSGLEWLYRFCQEPRRLASRYLKTNPVFVVSVLKQALFKQRKSAQ